MRAKRFQRMVYQAMSVKTEVVTSTVILLIIVYILSWLVSFVIGSFYSIFL